MALATTEIRGASGKDHVEADGIFPTFNESQSSGTGSDRLFICNVVWQQYGGSSASIDTVTFDSVSLTEARTISLVSGIYRTGVSIWYMLEADLPTSGSSATFEITWDDPSPSVAGVYSVWTAVYDNAAQEAPFTTEFKIATFGGGNRTISFDTDISEASSLFLLSFEPVDQTPNWTLNNGLTSFKENTATVNTSGFNWTANNLIDAPADTYNFTNITDDDNELVVGIAAAWGTGAGIQLVQPAAGSGTFDNDGTAQLITADRTESANLNALCLADTDLMYIVWVSAKQQDAEPLIDHIGFGTVSGYTNPDMTLAVSSSVDNGTTYMVTKMYYMLEADLPGTTATGWNWGIQWDANGGTDGVYHVHGQLLRGVTQGVPFDTDASSASSSTNVTSTIDVGLYNSLFTGGTTPLDGIGNFLTLNNGREFMFQPGSDGQQNPYPYYLPLGGTNPENMGAYNTYLLNVDPEVIATHDDSWAVTSDWATAYVTLEPVSTPPGPVTTVDASLLLGVS